ncbi:acyl-CoA dehydrogenase family protein [Kribbella sp. CA-253562]|uniref:acyl-CoA dehydrogenase family protein n=1 Tax=Kribbella sp. CA-253562 TaxID=3239942 RepID=UPI003D8F62B6
MTQHNVGMDPQEYTKLRERVFTTIWTELDPLEEEIENTEHLPLDKVMPALKDIGAFGFIVPAEYGGAGMSMSQYLPIIAEFAKIHGGIRCLVHVHNSFAHALSEIGTAEQRQAVLPGAARGDRSVAFALTEPDHGTGADLGSVATRTANGYVINGRKHLITNSQIATEFIYFAKTGPTEVSAFLVPRDSAGLHIRALPETMGCKGGEHGELTLVDVEVPHSALIGAEGAGVANLEAALEISRVFIAASSLGTSQRALELSLRHAKNRVTFGKPLEARQAIQRYLAEMAIDVQALGLMVADAGRKADRGLRIPAEASMVKQFGLEAVGRVTDRALLVHGGIGYTRKSPIERLYRDARLNWLEEGTPTIQYMVTAGQLIDGYQFSDPFAVGNDG